MAKESSEGGLLKKKSVDHNKKRIENLSQANAFKEKVIHLDQLEFLPIFPYSELLIWMLPAPNVTDHSYFNSVYLKIFTALSFLGNKRLVFYHCIVDLRIIIIFLFLMLKNPHICNTWIYPVNWVLHGFGSSSALTVPNLGMADREFELWLGSNMGSSDLEFGLETGPVRGLADTELAYYSSLKLDPNWFDKP